MKRARGKPGASMYGYTLAVEPTSQKMDYLQTRWGPYTDAQQGLLPVRLLKISKNQLSCWAVSLESKVRRIRDYSYQDCILSRESEDS
jgi:hypothetical protein